LRTPLLQQDFTLFIKDEYRKCAVKNAITLVACLLGFITDYVVFRIDED